MSCGKELGSTVTVIMRVLVHVFDDEEPVDSAYFVPAGDEEVTINLVEELNDAELFVLTGMTWTVWL